MPHQEQEHAKNEYEKPVLRRVELKTDEVLVVGCKDSLTSDVNGTSCDAKGCADLGS